MTSFPLRTPLAVGFLIFCGSALAQSSTLEFTNTDLPPIPLLDGSSVEFDGDGNVSAQCVLDGTVCEGIGSVAVGDAPTVSLSRTGSTGTVFAGNSITVAWTVGNAADVCVASSSPSAGVSGWQGTLGPATGSTTVSFASAGNYVLQMVCYNEAGANVPPATFSLTVEPSAGGGGGADPDECSLPPSSFIRPTGFTRHVMEWEDVFYGNSFPNFNSSFIVPVGSWTLRSSGNSGPPIAGRYFAIPFETPNSTTFQSNFKWLNAASVLAAGYTSPRAADNVLVTISPCAGDFRPPTIFSADPFITQCRALSNGSARIVYGTAPGSSCRLQPDTTYWLNIMFADPANGLTPTENTCSGGVARCEAMFRND